MKATAFFDVFLALAATATLAVAAGPASRSGKSAEVSLEPLAAGVKRVLLSPKAAERLGIQLDKVGEATLLRKQVVGGLVVPPLDDLAQPKRASGLFAGFAQAGAGAGQPPAAKTLPADDDTWLLVTLSPAEWERLAKDKPARLLPLFTRDSFPNEVLARPSGIEPVEDSKRSMLNVYYKVPGKNPSLSMYKRMRVELALAGEEGKQKVVPYGALYYDAKGEPWVYVNSAPLTYERRRVAVERVQGDLAVLTEGPPVGTPVVSVGAALLYGAEIFGR